MTRVSFPVILRLLLLRFFFLATWLWRGELAELRQEVQDLLVCRACFEGRKLRSAGERLAHNTAHSENIAVEGNPVRLLGVELLCYFFDFRLLFLGNHACLLINARMFCQVPSPPRRWFPQCCKEVNSSIDLVCMQALTSMLALCLRISQRCPIRRAAGIMLKKRIRKILIRQRVQRFGPGESNVLRCWRGLAISDTL